MCDLATKQKVRCAATEAKPRLGPVGASERKIGDAGPLLGALVVFPAMGIYVIQFGGLYLVKTMGGLLIAVISRGRWAKIRAAKSAYYSKMGPALCRCGALSFWAILPQAPCKPRPKR